LTATLVPKIADLASRPVSNLQLADPASVQTIVASKRMSPGAWRVSSQATVFGDGTDGIAMNDFIRCSLLANDTRIDGGATIRLTPDPSRDGDVQEIVNAGAFTSTTPWTLRLSCAHDLAVAGPSSHWYINRGMVLAVQKGPITS
jgi:hypothetical protein